MELKYLQINEVVTQTEIIILPDDTPMLNHNNAITTMKTTWFTFLPYNLLKQITQPANVYFIVIGILQMISVTSYTNGIPTIYGPLAVMIIINIIKDASEEYQRQFQIIIRYKSDQEENNRSSFKHNNQVFEECKWKNICQADIILIKDGESIPCDMLILSSNLQGGVAYVETKQIDGETNLKQKFSISEMQTIFHINNAKKYNNYHVKFTYDNKNAVLYKLSGSYQFSNHEVQQLSYANFIERDCSLRNTGWIVGLCVYAGMDCKIMLNCCRERIKRSRLEQVMRICIMTISFALIVFCLLASIYELSWTKNHIEFEYLGLTEQNIFIDLGLWFSLLSYFIPISLVTSVELVKFGQAKLLECDQVMLNSKAHQSNLIEQLGEVNFAFTDKTGTLTQNRMIFRELFSHNLQEALLCLCLCHSVMKIEGKFIGSSPDEIAMLEYCDLMGMKFQSVDNQQIMVVNGIQFQRIFCFEFTSEKKRMTIVIKVGNDYIVFCKGADEILFDLIGPCKHKMQLRQFAVQGYRTLVLGRKVISQEEINQLLNEFNDAEQNEELEYKVQQKLEQDIQFLGITAVEDILAEDVGITIDSLRQALIKIWVLTGDKVETSISIGYACNLLNSGDQVQIINECSVACIEEVFLHYCNETNNIALVISGQALVVMLNNFQLKQLFLKKALSAKVVIVARVSPKQKQQVVTLIKQTFPKCITLAIGDGANDVSMITEAHVGVGIQGVEGTQAARAADFSISEFKHLRRLMFYYGVECSRKNALTILYIFYKNQVFISPYFWFGIANGFSGQYLYDQWLSQLFNTFFASLPQILYALFDEMHPSTDFLEFKKTIHNQLENCPQLYAEYRNTPIFTFYRFWVWIVNGMFQGMMLLIFCLFTNENLDMNDGRTINFLENGVLIYGCAILLVNLKIFSFTYTNYNFTIFCVFGSVILYWITLLLLNDSCESESFDFYRYIKSPTIYWSLLLTCQLFLIDLACERNYDFMKYQKVEQSIELV